MLFRICLSIIPVDWEWKKVQRATKSVRGWLRPVRLVSCPGRSMYNAWIIQLAPLPLVVEESAWAQQRAESLRRNSGNQKKQDRGIWSCAADMDWFILMLGIEITCKVDPASNSLTLHTFFKLKVKMLVFWGGGLAQNKRSPASEFLFFSTWIWSVCRVFERLIQQNVFLPKVLQVH